MKRFRLLLSFLLLFTFKLTSGQEFKREFKASAVKIDITPKEPKMLLGYAARKSTGIHDRIYHRIVAMDDGVKQFFLVSTDICVMSPSEYDHVASLLEKELGIDPENFWWTLTHTHSAPEVGVPGLPELFMGDRYKHEVDTAYTSLVEQSLIKGIIEARGKLVKAKLGVGWGFSQANVNRRAIDENGKASLGLNPEGAVDRKIGLLRLEHEDGSAMALIANYAIHGTVLGPAHTEISGDAPGIVSDYVEQKLGVPLLFINGAAGNLAPIYSVYPNPKAGHLSQFKVLLGDKILEANKEIVNSRSDIKLFTGSHIIETPRKPNLSWPKDLSRYTQTSSSGMHMVLLPARFLKINEEVAIWSLPVELFCEISNEIRDRSPFPFTFFYGYTNGWLGYLPTEKEWKYGGYEVETVSPYTPIVEKHLKEAILGYLEGEMKSNISSQPQSNNKPSLVRADAGGLLRLSARNGKGISPNIKYMPEWWAFGWFTNSDRVEWDVEVELDGDYQAELVWSVSDKEAGTEYLLEAGKKKLSGVVDRSGSWETFKSKNIGIIPLKQGIQKIVFRSKEPAIKSVLLDLREIKLSPVSNK